MSCSGGLTAPFSAEKKCELIELVKSTPCLWNPSIQSYRFPDKKEREWIKIAEKLEVSSVNAKKQWDNLRGQYSRNKKARNQPSGSAAVNTPPWGFYSQMEFLAGIVKPRATSGNMSSSGHVESGDNSDGIGDSLDHSARARSAVEETAVDGELFVDDSQRAHDTPGTNAPARDGDRVAGSLKRRHGSMTNDPVSQAILKELSKESDEDQLFADFIAASLRKLGPRLKINARLEIQRVLSNAELCQITERAYPPPASEPQIRSPLEVQIPHNLSSVHNGSPSPTFHASGSPQERAGETTPTYATLQPVIPSQPQCNGSLSQDSYVGASGLIRGDGSLIHSSYGGY